MKNLKLTRKIILSFFILMVLVGATYVTATVFFTNRFVQKTTQELNADIANHIIDEKFKDASPFLEDGTVNKELFGDLMHDMMAVNRGIEVYLLDRSGEVLYSVVLDHEKSNQVPVKVNLGPVKQFINSDDKGYVLGDDPRAKGDQKIFSAAAYNIDGHEGYMYIILASQAYEGVASELSTSYFADLGLWITLITILFALLIGFLVIRYLTRNLRDVVFTVKRFKEGDLSARIPEKNGTDFQELALTFNEMADTTVKYIDEMKEVQKLRQELTANISHDLRSPIAVSQGYIETMLMKKEELNATEREKYLEIVLASMGKLTKLVAQLFEYSKLQANQVKLEKEAFSIEELASDVVANYKGIADNRNIELKLSADKEMSLVFADIALVDRVLQNLMDNALKYTPDGGLITLQIHSNNENVSFTIQDSGPGIPEGEQLLIFERYVHGTKKGGTGLGLAIVKRIIDLHNTKIEVLSRPDEGAAFRFELQTVL